MSAALALSSLNVTYTPDPPVFNSLSPVARGGYLKLIGGDAVCPYCLRGFVVENDIVATCFSCGRVLRYTAQVKSLEALEAECREATEKTLGVWSQLASLRNKAGSVRAQRSAALRSKVFSLLAAGMTPRRVAQECGITAPYVYLLRLAGEAKGDLAPRPRFRRLRALPVGPVKHKGRYAHQKFGTVQR